MDPHASVSSAFVGICGRAEHRNKYYFIRVVNGGSVSQGGLCLTAYMLVWNLTQPSHVGVEFANHCCNQPIVFFFFFVSINTNVGRSQRDKNLPQMSSAELDMFPFLTLLFSPQMSCLHVECYSYCHSAARVCHENRINLSCFIIIGGWKFTIDSSLIRRSKLVQFYAFLLNYVSMQNDNPIDGTNCRKHEVVVS